MSMWRKFTRGLRTLTNRSQVDGELTDEMQHYLEQITRENEAGGMSTLDAKRAAHMELGNMTAVREQVRSHGWEQLISAFFTDVRYALRMLRKSPVFTIVVILVVSLGSGAVTTIYSGVNALMLRPLQGTTDGARLISIDRKHPSGKEGMSASYDYYKFLRDQTQTLDGVGAWTNAALTISNADGGVAAFGNIVSGNYFKLLGVRPLLGRFFLQEEDVTPRTHAVIVMSEQFWRIHQGSDSSIIGKQVKVNGYAFTVIGVAPPNFRGVFTPLKVDAWVPLMMQPVVRPGRDMNAAWLKTFGRLRDGATAQSASQELSAITARYVKSVAVEPEWARKYTVSRTYALTGLPDDAKGMLFAFAAVLFAAAVLVLVIASVNVASMLSARAIARRREMAVRAALGAGRSRLIRQLLTESLVLFAFGALGGMLVAIVATRALEQLPVPEEIVLRLAPDFRVLAFALAVSLITGVVFGLAPALQTVRQDIVARLRADTAGSGVRRSMLGNALIVSQMALSLVLLVSAGLFLRTLKSGADIDIGFDVTNVSAATMNTEGWGYNDTKGRLFYNALRERLKHTTGVEFVTYAQNVPLAYEVSPASISIGTAATAEAGSGDGAENRVTVQLNPIAPDYFAVLRMPIMRGRGIDAGDVASDSAGAPQVAVINETLAKVIDPRGDAIGKTFLFGKSRVSVVGVSRNAKYESFTEKPPMAMYFAMNQFYASRQTLLIRTRPGAEPVVSMLRRGMREIDPALPVPVVRTLKQRTDVALLPQRVAAMVTGALGAVGLLLATIGLYGTMSYSANRRTREIGIRTALGAQHNEILRMMVGDGMRLAAFGVGIGVLAAALVTRLLTPYLINVSPLDTVTFAVMSALFALVACLASYLPARRASSSDPMLALRTD